MEETQIQSWVGNIPWRRKWQPTPVFLSGKFHGHGAWQATVYGSQRVRGDWPQTYVTDKLCKSPTKQSANLVLFRKIKACLYTAPAPSSQPLTPPLPPTLNSATKNFHWVISRLIHPQTLLWEFPHLSARVETPASMCPSFSRSSGSDGRTVLHVGPCCFQKLFLYLGVKQTTKKHTIATANPAPLGLLLPSVAFFPLALWLHYLQILARYPRALPPGPGTQLRDWAPRPSVAAPQPRSLRSTTDFVSKYLMIWFMDHIFLSCLMEFFSLMETSNLFFQLLCFAFSYCSWSSQGSQNHWSGLLFPSPVDQALSKLSTMTHLSILGGPTQHGS